ncbi:BQ2448_2813 [Microbotryum intermedium]|uniref:Large ribosomal subunit protein bL28m n=1 Tax=Microbotryum intermedium TaxID=269621 RepID=A0A238FDH2_9BASI|nr:BQ2448_2813 [Microbotryum intermedium]
MFPSLPLLRGTSRSSWLPKRFQTGLYDGRSLQSGSSIGETFSSKTRRRWLPNVQTKRIYSEALSGFLKLRVTTGALRTMDKCGGFDQYLFRMKEERLGRKGVELRQAVRSRMQAPRLDAEMIN